MNNYVLENVTEFSINSSLESTYLIVHKLHRTPYHIGIIYQKKYYSLSITGVEIIESSVVFESLADKKQNNLILEIKHDKGDGIDSQQIFNNYALDPKAFHTCLLPVKVLLAKLTANNKLLDANNLFELLETLISANLVGSRMATRITPVMESKIVLVRYDNDAIKNHIIRLQERQIGEDNKKHTS